MKAQIKIVSSKQEYPNMSLEEIKKMVEELNNKKN